jgi:uncharacterized protein (TIGR00297 family)
MVSFVPLSLLLAALVSLAAVKTGALTRRAAVASTAVGSLVFEAGGIRWSLPLLLFFATSSLLSHVPAAQSSIPDRIAGPDSARRTARQVLANGSAPALWSVCQLLGPSGLWAALFSAAVATAAADTWATEVGRRSGAIPRDMLTGRRVPLGTSGGVTVPGLTASLAGSAMVALACFVTGSISFHDSIAVTMAGFGGALLDSLLGASLQERRWCPTCSIESEDTVHSVCHTQTIHHRGVSGLDNDWVNLTATLAGSGLGLLLILLL